MTTLKPLPDVYRSWCNNGKDRIWSWHRSLLLKSEWEHLERFLTATMDEIRLFHAEEFARGVLRLSDLDDCRYFRRAVLMRELSATMGYDKQRDHAAHTLHNYLLGMFIFERSSLFRDQCSEQLARRLGKQNSFENFANLWSIPTLLHDIGYLFEGSLTAQDISLSSRMASLGAKYANEYFTHQMWRHLGLDTHELQARTLAIAHARLPVFRKRSLLEIADGLRTLTSMKAVTRCLRASTDHLLKLPDGPADLSSDAFELWEQNYRAYGCGEMADRVLHLRAAHSELLNNGIPDVGVRILDHGICGALLQLQVSCLWFEIYCSLPDELPDEPLDAVIWKKFKSEGGQARPEWFWAIVIWCTAAVAFHNIAQAETWAGCKPGIDLRIKIEDDALTYLGILVDILEEWDRYTVRRNSVFTGTNHLPVQSCDVRLGVGEDGRVIIYYPTKKVGTKVVKALSESLINWESVVEIQS